MSDARALRAAPHLTITPAGRSVPREIEVVFASGNTMASSSTAACDHIPLAGTRLRESMLQQ